MASRAGWRPSGNVHVQRLRNVARHWLAEPVQQLRRLSVRSAAADQQNDSAGLELSAPMDGRLLLPRSLAGDSPAYSDAGPAMGILSADVLRAFRHGVVRS